MKDVEIVDPQDQKRTGRPEQRSALNRLNATLGRYGMYLSVGGLFVIVVIVVYQVFGRYVLNSSPTWTESFALVLVLTSRSSGQRWGFEMRATSAWNRCWSSFRRRSATASSW